MKSSMKKERILSHKMSQKLTAEDLEGVSASGTSVATASATYSRSGGTDMNADVNIDM